MWACGTVPKQGQVALVLWKRRWVAEMWIGMMIANHIAIESSRERIARIAWDSGQGRKPSRCNGNLDSQTSGRR